MSFGSKVRTLRLRKGIGQNELAEVLGYKSFTTIQKWESGESMPPFAKMKQMAEYFGVTIEFLTEIESEDKPSKEIPLQKPTYSPTLVKLVKTAQNLNEEGQGKLSDYADDLDSSGKYRKLSDAPATYKDKNGFIKVVSNGEGEPDPYRFVANSRKFDDGSGNQDINDMIKKLQEDDIGGSEE